MLTRRALLRSMIAAAGLAAAAPAMASDIRSHPVRGWKGNQFLFEVRPEAGGTRLICYRARGAQWERVGTTLLRPGQKKAEQGWIQNIWFNGRKLPPVSADMRNPFWRYYPSQERGGRIFP
jgi:hypothetical protein